VLSVASPLRALGLFSLALLLAGLGAGCSSSSEPLPPARDNPLPACPESPNCERFSASFSVPPPQLFEATVRALEALEAERVTRGPDSLRAAAVFRVAWVFQDDVAVAVTARPEGGSLLHARSASRVGYSDLGVNRRRLQRLREAVNMALMTMPGAP
jgi:uncharacterized protein (DUF1499 family)